jgi:hypothetical protein
MDLIEQVGTAWVQTVILATQFVEQSETLALFESMREVAKILFIVGSIALMMLTPAVLGFAVFDRFFNFKKFCNKLRFVNSTDHSHHSRFVKWLCSGYRRSYADYMGTLFGLGSWVVFSFAYVISSATSFSEGLRNYFAFPFDVIRAAQESGWNIVESELYSRWLFMLSIVIVSLVFFLLGRMAGDMLAAKRLDASSHPEISAGDIHP